LAVKQPHRVAVAGQTGGHTSSPTDEGFAWRTFDTFTLISSVVERKAYRRKFINNKHSILDGVWKKLMFYQIIYTATKRKKNVLLKINNKNNIHRTMKNNTDAR
jgi:hypothetical protein